MLTIKIRHGVVIGADTLFRAKKAIRTAFHVDDFFLRSQWDTAALAKITKLKAFFTHYPSLKRVAWSACELPYFFCRLDTSTYEKISTKAVIVPRIGARAGRNGGGPMIYVNQEQLEQVQYLLEQSAKGVHLLFDKKTIKRIASQLGKKEERTMRIEKAEGLLEQMILCTTLQSKKNFLETLDPDTYDDVAKVYFNIVQNSASEKQRFTH